MCQCTQFGTLRDSRQCSQDWSRLGFVSATPWLRSPANIVARHAITLIVCLYYYVPQARKLVFPLQLRVTECCLFRYRGIQCKNWTAYAHIVLQRNAIFFLFFFFSLLLRTALAPYWQSLLHLNCACVYFKIDKIKMAGTSRDISSVMTSAAKN